MISFVLSESMGSGHGSGSRLPVVTTVTFTFAFFVLGPSDMLMGIATSLETLVGVGSSELLHGCSGSVSGDSPLSKPMKLNGPSTTAMLLEYSSPVMPSDVEGYKQHNKINF